jgi:hypothetical protein
VGVAALVVLFADLAGVVVMLVVIGLDVRRVERRLADIERRLSADDKTATG